MTDRDQPDTPILAHCATADAGAERAIAALLAARPPGIASLSLETQPDDGKLMLYYGIDPASLAERPEQLAAVLEFLERATRDIELAAGHAPICVAIAAAHAP